MMTLMTVFFLRLILAEEAFLTAQLGQPYLDYLRAVPRLFPRLRTILSHSAPKPTGRKPQWLHALITEINPIGIFIALAFFSWSYNNWLMIRVVLVSFGLSMIQLNKNGEKPLRLLPVVVFGPGLLLLRWGDRVLGGLGHAELDHRLGLDLDGFAGLRVASDAGLALRLHQAADAGNHKYAVLLGFLDGRLCQKVQEGCHLLVGQFQFLGQ
jgi:protein-S-isoprenylcysteine O-methyltransferase Ste14